MNKVDEDRDLFTLPTPSDDSIAKRLQSRYERSLPYTRAGHSTLIVVNPYQPLALLNDDHRDEYAKQGYRDFEATPSTGVAPLEPHAYDLAARVYFHMRRTGEDQSIVLSGITGSGKSSTRMHLLDELLLLSTHSKKELQLQKRIKDANVILEQFGHARTGQNVSASKFGLFQELQFSEKGRIIGTKILTYAMDKGRVTSVPRNEGLFHVFYSLLTGTSDEEKKALNMERSLDDYAYLRNSNHAAIQGKSDSIAFSDLKAALKACDFKNKDVSNIFKLLSVILRLGNVEFIEKPENDLAQEACCVKNMDTLETIANMLEISPTRLNTSLTYKLRMIHRDMCSVVTDPKGAAEQRNSLARALYHALFLWIVEKMNKKICYVKDDNLNFVGILDQFGFQNVKENGFEEFCMNFANERLHQFIIEQRFSNDEGLNAMMKDDGVPLNSITTMDNIGCLKLLVGEEKERKAQETAERSAALGLGGVAGDLNRDCANYQAGKTDATEANFLATLKRKYGNHPSFAKPDTFAFGINHYAGSVYYNVDMFLEKNVDDISPDFVSLLQDSQDSFVANLFQNTVMATESHPKDDRTIVKAQLSSKPTRAPSMRRNPTTRRRAKIALAAAAIPEDEDVEEKEREKKIKEAEEAYQNMPMTTVLDQLYMTLRDLFLTMENTRLYNIIHIRPNDMQRPGDFDQNRVKTQIRTFLLPDIIRRCSTTDYANYYGFYEFLERYSDLDMHVDASGPDGSPRDQVQRICAMRNWPAREAMIGNDIVWLSYEAWKSIEDDLRQFEKEERDRAKAGLSYEEKQIPLTDGSESNLGGFGAPHVEGHSRYLSVYDDNASYAASDLGGKSQWGEESEWGAHVLAEGFGPNMDMRNMTEDVQPSQFENVEEVPITALRRWWVRIVWLMTWWIPSPFLRWFGKMKREDVQLAWREKVTICIGIFFFSAIVIFVIVGLGEIICPGTKNMYSPANVQAHALQNDVYMSSRGVAYDVSNFMRSDHGTTLYPASQDVMMTLAGLDVSYTIPPPLTVACANLVTDPTVKVQPNNTIVVGSFVHYSGDQLSDATLSTMKDPNWYANTFLPTMNLYKKGSLVHSLDTIQNDYKGWGRKALIINGRVYDITDYLTTANYYDQGSPTGKYHYLNPAVEQIFNTFSGTDATDNWNKYKSSMSAEDQANNMNCLNNMFYIGDQDVRDTARCMLTNYLLLAFAMLMCLVIVVKFLAALQFGGAPAPEDHDKFVICQVPCYTEDEDSIKKTIDSLTVLEYDDRRKLLLIIADGMIMGSGNDRPTPRIVLDVLGYDTKNDPEPLMFKSIGDGSKQLNYGKVYSGLYECEGHVVPYIVIAKVGKASERAKPGNRGKRDSQLICMNFLNKVHYDSEMTPMELEMYHQIKNVIGVDPSFYEYILMIDSDTAVKPDALNQMISCMLHDGSIVGLCGETKLSNQEESWTTMIQVYEYYISHHLAKAFESLFGSVTCLPGCFCMYRIRTPIKNEPLIISPKVIHEYAENHVDTLHKKNLLHLGEDRYLTTLMMKHFPQLKMKFTPHAQCETVAPDKWKVLLSQRRRWINSTIHNLFEVVLLPNLCGFCCFSMRFVVLIDLIGTLTLPVTVVYLVYLIYVIASHSGPFPTIALCMLAGVYGLQAILFILKREWQHIGWMIFYILAIPVFSFFLPLYSFWHFDDFSWGNTRVVVGDKQKKIIVVDDEKFDEKMIPLKKWSVYERELREFEPHETGTMSPRRGSYHSSAVFANQEAINSRSSLMGGYVQQTPPYQQPYPTGFMQSAPSYTGSDAGSVIGYQEYPMSRMSEIAPMGAYPTSHYSIPMSEGGFSMPPGFPSDEMIQDEVRHIISTSNLMSVTKKNVRQKLSSHFGFDMTAKKQYINACIDDILQNSPPPPHPLS